METFCRDRGSGDAGLRVRGGPNFPVPDRKQQQPDPDHQSRRNHHQGPPQAATGLRRRCQGQRGQQRATARRTRRVVGQQKEK